MAKQFMFSMCVDMCIYIGFLAVILFGVYCVSNMRHPIVYMSTSTGECTQIWTDSGCIPCEELLTLDKYEKVWVK